MADRFEVKIDTSQLNADMQKLAASITDGRPFLGKWAKYDMPLATERTMQRVGRASTGGSDDRMSSAGIPAWPPAAIQYERKTDGVTVPAWGGVPKARAINKAAPGKRRSSKPKVFRGGELVKGRKRGSGQRMAATSRLMYDTHEMVNSTFASPKILTKNLVRLAPSIDYAEHARDASTPPRTFLFIAPADEAKLTKRAEDHFRELVRKQGLDR